MFICWFIGDLTIWRVGIVGLELEVGFGIAVAINWDSVGFD